MCASDQVLRENRLDSRSPKRSHSENRLRSLLVIYGQFQTTNYFNNVALTFLKMDKNKSNFKFKIKLYSVRISMIQLRVDRGRNFRLEKFLGIMNLIKLSSLCKLDLYWRSIVLNNPKNCFSSRVTSLTDDYVFIHFDSLIICTSRSSQI